MANLLTHSLTFSKESVREYLIKPLFSDSDIRAVVSVRDDIKTSEKIDFVGNLEYITKAYAQGTSFVPSTGVTVTQKTLTVYGLKAEVQQNGKAFLNWVKQELLKKGVDENDISGTLFEQIVMELFMKGIKNDLVRQMFFGAEVAETITLTGSLGSPSGVADTRYNVYKGFWPRIIDAYDAVEIPAAQLLDINVVTTYQTTAAVAGEKTSTITGTSGTANITINGVAYLATFNTSLTQTATDFVATHGPAILARMGKCTLTVGVGTVKVTAGVPGMNVTVSAPVNVSGDLAGSVATTTAAVRNTTLVSGGSNAIFQAMWDKMTPELREYVGKGLQFYTTTSVADNYMKTLEALNGSEVAYGNLVNGQRQLNFRGIPINIRQDWDVRIANDFAGIRPHRALLTIPENLWIGTDGSSDDTNVELFYDRVTQNNVFRVEYKAGTQFAHEKLFVAAY